MTLTIIQIQEPEIPVPEFSDKLSAYDKQLSIRIESCLNLSEKSHDRPTQIYWHLTALILIEESLTTLPIDTPNGLKELRKQRLKRQILLKNRKRLKEKYNLT